MITGICMIVKDCDPEYLKEFIEWHSFIGIDYFFIYDNGSKNPIKEILNNNDFEKNIFIYDFPGKGVQLNAYLDCLKRQQTKVACECDWIAFIDDDEFIVPECGNIKEVLLEYDSYSGLSLNWMEFGAKGKFKTNEKQLIKFTNALPKDYMPNIHIKSIVKPKNVERFLTPHNCKYIKGYCVNLLHEKIEGSFCKNPIHTKMWINHYYYKSEEDFRQKIERGRADSTDPKMQLTMDRFYNNENLETFENLVAKNLYLKFKQHGKF